MLPLRDDNPTSRRPVATIAVIIACAVVYFLVQGGAKSLAGADATDQPKFTYEHAAIPCEVVQGHPLTEREVEETLIANNADACQKHDTSNEVFPGKSIYLALFVSMFLHASLLHIGGNMLYLWIFGNNIEDRLTALGFLGFYIVGGLVATLGHVALDPNSTVPVVGASGAIAAVMGAYLVLYPKARVHSLIILGFIPLFRRVPAWLLLGFWFLSQFAVDPTSGVAWAAHVTGFAFGVLAGFAMRAIGTGSPPAPATPQWA